MTYVVWGDRTFLWVVRPDRGAFLRLDIGRQELKDAVTALRGGLDQTPRSIADVLAFDTEEAFLLYDAIFAPAVPLLKGAGHVFVVPDGALQSLPVDVLVTKEPKRRVRKLEDYAEVPWLANKYAMTVLPSVSSLRALRHFAKASNASRPFVGFGDPLLDGDPGKGRGVDVAALFARGAVADVDSVRKLPRLPDTADELNTLAGSLKADDGSLFLRERATETAVRSQNLSRYRVLAFATHGLVTGELEGVAEPALVFTPPETGSESDDGLLTASEIATLKLDADWVILSACNTAAADGTPGAEGLSGLAKAFFYAGARALLVSHWSVVSDAAVRLTTTMFDEVRDDPDIGRAEALRRARLALMVDEDKPYYAHPMFWAPFVVVGEGGQQVTSLPRAVLDCDRLAGHPEDNTSVYGLGVPWDDLDPIRAIPACEVAVREFPDVQRLKFQHARALNKAGEFESATRIYQELAQQGYAQAQTNLGSKYRDGEGVQQDYVEAAKLYRLAADQGNVGAQYYLGDMYYYEGQGVSQDYGEAARWYRLAADLGEDNAQYSLGYMYEKGEGVSKNDVEAAKWYHLAASP